MLSDGNRPNDTRQNPCPIASDTRREQLLNRLCELQEDPRFAEWCRLTSALGLGGLTLGQLAALSVGAAEAAFPEVGEWGQSDANATLRSALDMLVPFSLGGRAGKADTVLGDGITSDSSLSRHADGVSSPGVEWSELLVGTGDGAFDGHTASVPAHDGRVE